VQIENFGRPPGTRNLAFCGSQDPHDVCTFHFAESHQVLANLWVVGRDLFASAISQRLGQLENTPG
jgi:hypothetical protein